MYLMRLCSNAEQITPPTLFSSSLNAILPSNTSIGGFQKKISLTSGCLTVEPKDLGRLQLLMENRGAGFTVSPERLSEGNTGQITVLTLKCAKMEGNGAPGRSGEGFSIPSLSHTPHPLPSHG